MKVLCELVNLLHERVIARETLGSAVLDSCSFCTTHPHSSSRVSVAQHCPVCPGLLWLFAFASNEAPLLCSVRTATQQCLATAVPAVIPACGINVHALWI